MIEIKKPPGAPSSSYCGAIGQYLGSARTQTYASDAILLERKDDMRRRGLASPDDGDALALTFAYPVAKKDWADERRFEEGLQRLKRWVR